MQGLVRRGLHITKDMCFPGSGTHITSDMCFPDRGTHITRVLCVLGRRTHISRDMCFRVGEVLSLVLSLGFCVSRVGKHIFLVIVFPYQGDLVRICAFWVGEHI